MVIFFHIFDGYVSNANYRMFFTLFLDDQSRLWLKKTLKIKQNTVYKVLHNKIFSVLRQAKKFHPIRWPYVRSQGSKGR